MANITPFKAVRAARDKVALVSSKSYEMYAQAKLNAKLAFNPYSFLHIINPGYKYNMEVSGQERFQLVYNRYQEFKEKGIYQKDELPAFYIYQKISTTNSYTGIIAATNVSDYQDNRIKRHEGTLPERESLFESYLKDTGFNAEPVLLTYKDTPEISDILQGHQASRAEYEFSTTDQTKHLLWIVNDPIEVETISKAVQQIEALYIADGHHRCTASCLLANHMAAQNPQHNGTESYNYFMSYLIPESQLKISEFNRYVRDLNNLSVDEFLIKLDQFFLIEKHGSAPYTPSEKHHFSMYLDGEFYALKLRMNSYPFSDALSKLDVEILYQTVLEPILGISDIKNDKRIGYAQGKGQGFLLKDKVDHTDYRVGFGMVPVHVKEIKEIADEGLEMPPKSTYIQPKLRSGLTIYEF